MRDWEMKMAEGRNHNSALRSIEVVGPRNGSSAHDNQGDQAAGWYKRESSFPEVPRWKRIFDITCVLVTLPVWLPLIILVMAWIVIASRGPVFFRQERVGYRRRPFMLFKFRTMHVNAETQTHAEYFFCLVEAACTMTKIGCASERSG